MNMANLLKGAANILMGASLVKWLAADLKAEIRRDSINLQERSNLLVRQSPYRAAILAAAAGAVTGAILAHRSHRTIPTRF